MYFASAIILQVKVNTKTNFFVGITTDVRYSYDRRVVSAPK
jgi:hypothetical protein